MALHDEGGMGAASSVSSDSGEFVATSLSITGDGAIVVASAVTDKSPEPSSPPLLRSAEIASVDKVRSALAGVSVEEKAQLLRELSSQPIEPSVPEQPEAVPEVTAALPVISQPISL